MISFLKKPDVAIDYHFVPNFRPRTVPIIYVLTYYCPSKVTCSALFLPAVPNSMAAFRSSTGRDAFSCFPIRLFSSPFQKVRKVAEKRVSSFTNFERNHFSIKFSVTKLYAKSYLYIYGMLTIVSGLVKANDNLVCLI